MMIRTLSLLACTAAAAYCAEIATKPLAAGAKIPDVAVRSEQNKEVRLRELVAEKPTVLVFYRGGWCPFCTRHLQGLQEIQKDLQAAGAQLAAISMDTPAKLRATPKREQLSYRLFSDSSAQAVNAFGIGFRVDDATVTKYKDSYKIDLEASSGQTHHLLPHPAIFVADTNGVIRYAHVNKDFQVRMEPAKILEAVRAAMK